MRIPALKYWLMLWAVLIALIIWLAVSPPGLRPSPDGQASSPAGSDAGRLHPPPGTADIRPSSEPVVTHATIYAAGDIMAHMPQLPAYYDEERGKYDFSPWFSEVRPILETGDWVVGNLETPLAGEDLKYSGFPRFNAPAELADALAGAGFQLISTANNHALDRGFAGVVRTLDHLDAAGLTAFGTARSAEEAARLVIEERNGIRMGFAAYTYGTNGIPAPADKPYAVNLLTVERIREDVRRLREAGADAVALFLHFGVEYERTPNERQRSIARSAIEAGADLVLGSHPHVVQPYETIEVPHPDDPGAVRRGIVIYSLGNLISNQQDRYTNLGLIFGLTLTKTVYPDGSSELTWGEPETIPTWVYNRKVNRNRFYTILPLPQMLAGDRRPEFSPSDYRRMEADLADMTAHLHSLTSTP